MPSYLEEAPPLPEGLLYLWDIYSELFTGETLTFTELGEWSRVMGISLEGWEAQLIKELDRDFWRVRHDGYRKP